MRGSVLRLAMCRRPDSARRAEAHAANDRCSPSPSSAGPMWASRRCSTGSRASGSRIVHDTPGVTRDRQEADARVRRALRLRLIDTAGFEKATPGSLAARMTEQTAGGHRGSRCRACSSSTRRAGVTAGDEIIAEALRRSRQARDPGRQQMRRPHRTCREAYRARLRRSRSRSRPNMRWACDDLSDALEPFAAAEETARDEDEPTRRRNRRRRRDDDRKPAAQARHRRRPNVGKSSLFNRLLGEERSLTGPEAGLTRDAIARRLEDGRPRRSCFTTRRACARRRARRARRWKQMSVGSDADAIRFAECVIVVIDATAPFEKQDLTIADLIAREGRAIVFAVNKWDLVEEQGRRDHRPARNGSTGCCRRSRARRWSRSRPDRRRARPSAARRARRRQGLEHARADSAAQPFPRGRAARHPPPAVSGRRVRIRYMTQAKSRPPTFALFGNQLDALARSLSALSAERTARGVRPGRRADALLAAHVEESVRGVRTRRLIASRQSPARRRHRED